MNCKFGCMWIAKFGYIDGLIELDIDGLIELDEDEFMELDDLFVKL